MRTPLQLAALITLLIFTLHSAIAQAETYYFHNDHLGTPQVLTDQYQAVVWQAEYDPFGKATETVATVEQNLRFPGQYLERETGLHYNYFRDYDPAIGRYLQSDPIGLGGGINTFGYAYQNPLSNTDPTGEFVPAIVWWAATGLWAAFEIAGSAYDLYGTIATFADECSSITEKAVAGAVFAAGLFLPGAGYSAMAKVAKGATELSNSAQKGIRSLEKRIAEHEKKLADFKANPTVRPGMEGQPESVIKAAQESRVRHLEKEIQTFRENIDKLKGEQ